ncbi:Exodeoxyribonuclease V beta chain [Candidatus Burkholderia verschuerenii]|uniref:RecBCD enzyme subunit RecB n=1 Tax=Candidatus Burkholderia verschuerenii TaxID=242163 RepID=A0A0L0MDU1_9BURK|nr:exodeoxyribonuclease V subunit beta [Candidatus Burkholderia verschuerenii]KND60503.1 Exodeoxyribonuclease V beta chain [Candidatus Burkholderia verschuerenii]
MSAQIDRDEHTPQPLQPLSFPLSGRSLIEASAGTGKTFTIAMLYVRLVLGHDPGNASARPLTPPEILVVTFTDAATKELRNRIRARLTQAARYFQQAAEDSEDDDPLLHDLREQYDEHLWPSCARSLQLAAEWMDEAAVSTIHGWCNRMLREHAFDSDSLFSQTLETDQSDLLAEAVRDYWRTFMTPLDGRGATLVSTWVKSPAELQQKLRNLVDVAALLPQSTEPDEVLEARARKLDALKAPWKSWPEEMGPLLDAERTAKRLSGTSYRRDYCERWLAALTTWANDPHAASPELKTGWDRLTAEALLANCKGTPPSHPGFDALSTLRAELAELDAARTDILAHAARWVAERFAAEQTRRAQMGFNDLLSRLDNALHGPNGARLAEVIRQQFPVALIDEFQDTDPVQYRIFDAVYGARADRDETQHTLIMIGDPKQAIYAFRGADIFTYLDARRSCGTRLYTLAKNFRSTHEMVAAVNHCFAIAETRADGRGGFLFRDEAANPVPFIEVSAQGRAEAFAVDGETQRALTVWYLPPDGSDEGVRKSAYLSQMAASCASEMVRLLNLGLRDEAGFDSDDGRRALRPADMAVLVNNFGEAHAIRSQLSARGVRSVYLPERSSVLTSDQAGEIAHWLAACAEPEDGRLVRSALATSTLGLSFTELDALFCDEARWEACVLQFRGYRECWRRQGVLPMLRRLLNDFHVPARLLKLNAPSRASDENTDGERVLTDLLHLAELLQQASTLIEGEHGLIRHLLEEREAAQEGTGGDARQMRLESDGDLVKIVTIHKSKGLEYPLVFLPFACAYRAVDEKAMPLKWHDDAGRLHVAIEGTAGNVAQADEERLGEDLRKLYVALTRARHATWIGMAALDDLERSAIGYLLSGQNALGPARFVDALEAGFGVSAHTALLAAPEPGIERYMANDEAAHRGEPRRSARVVREPWWIASYSSLKTSDGVYTPAPETPDEDVFIETRDAQSEAEEDEDATLAPAPVQATSSALHDFPRGSEQGSFLHDLLEWAAQQGFAEVAKDPAMLREVVARRCSVRGLERWIDTLTDWLMRIVTTPFVLRAEHGMQATSVTLSRLPSALGEMEFWFAAARVDTLELDRLVCAHTFGGADRPALEQTQLNGMLKGFMDLVFEHDGRYYVADYKSNWLGADDAAYTPERIRAQMLRSRYDLQFVLYLLGLHRLLKTRLPDYDYDTHMGGAVYLFVRGLNAASQGVCAECPPRELIERLDALFMGETHALAAGLEIE